MNPLVLRLLASTALGQSTDLTPEQASPALWGSPEETMGAFDNASKGAKRGDKLRNAFEEAKNLHKSPQNMINDAFGLFPGQGGRPSPQSMINDAFGPYHDQGAQQPSPLDDAQWPSGPMGAPGQQPPPGQPMSLEPGNPGPSSPQMAMRAPPRPQGPQQQAMAPQGPSGPTGGGGNPFSDLMEFFQSRMGSSSGENPFSSIVDFFQKDRGNENPFSSIMDFFQQNGLMQKEQMNAQDTQQPSPFAGMFS